MRYRLTIERIEPHPKAGERVEPFAYNGGYPDKYPETTSTQVLLMEVPEDSFNAIRRAALESIS